MRETVVWTISLPPKMASEVEALADKEQRNRSELVREALRQYMAMREWTRLQAKATVKARQAGVRDENDIEKAIDEVR